MNELGQKTKDQVWPEKIFLRRTSGTRKVTNAVELEKILLDRGYVIVEPEKLTFVQQTQLFNNAKEIVALTGAALSNAVFCKPGTHVAILMGKHEDMIYNYWSNMLAPLQVRVFYVLGDIVKNHDLGIHGDFFVNETALMDLLEVFGKK
jgi:capsular polysaccharide biosynthesis protein